ncbi:MAG: helix-turn-helix transcriptional regulator [Lachnospiraceae bacterium]|nr:helix-turn-helix transcriptional regulator [Lachnospiraceae bacterium]
MKLNSDTAPVPDQTPSTLELEHELKAASNIEDYFEKHSSHMLLRSLPEHLKMLLDQKGISRADVVRNSLLNRTYVYQIFDGRRMPSRNKLIAIAFGMRLSVEETQAMLKLSGYRNLYAKDERDAILLFSLNQKMNVEETNELLYDHSMEILGVPEK